MRAVLLAAALLSVAATIPPAADPPPAPLREVVRVVDRPWLRVGITVTVTDRTGAPVRGLTRDDFAVTEDGAAVALEDFGVEGERADRPLSVFILLDLSQSMGSQVRDVRAAARTLIETLRPGDEAAVAKFSDQLTVLMSFTADPGDPDRALKSLGLARGGTALFRAIEEAVKDLRGRRGRKVVLVVSDGLDNYEERAGHVLSSLYLQDLLRLCFRTETVVYGIRPGAGTHSWTRFEGFVTEAGGRLLYTGGDLPRLFARLGEEFRSQYHLAWEIDPKIKDGRRRQVRVAVRRPEVVVRTIGGYFTPASRIDTLLRDADDDEPEMRADAVFDLGFVDDPRAIETLRAALLDRDPKVRLLAAGALARLRSVDSIPRLARLLDDRDGAVRLATAEALRPFGIAALDPVAGRVAAGAGERRARDGTILAARLLGEIGDDRAAAPLATLMTEGSPPARVEAARALGRLGMMAALAPLKKTLADDSEPAARLAAGESIVAIAGSAACDLILARAGTGAVAGAPPAAVAEAAPHAVAGAEPDAVVRDGLRRALAALPPPGCARMPASDRR